MKINTTVSPNVAYLTLDLVRIILISELGMDQNDVMIYNQKFRLPKGFELHHWNYNSDFLTDIIILKAKDHRKSHTYLILDKSLLIFKTEDGKILDSRNKHVNYLIEKGVNI